MDRELILKIADKITRDTIDQGVMNEGWYNRKIIDTITCLAHNHEEEKKAQLEAEQHELNAMQIAEKRKIRDCAFTKSLKSREEIMLRQASISEPVEDRIEFREVKKLPISHELSKSDADAQMARLRVLEKRQDSFSAQIKERVKALEVRLAKLQILLRTYNEKNN